MENVCENTGYARYGTAARKMGEMFILGHRIRILTLYSRLYSSVRENSIKMNLKVRTREVVD